MLFWLNSVSLIIVGMSIKWLSAGITTKLYEMDNSDIRIRLLTQQSYFVKLSLLIVCLVIFQMVYVHKKNLVSFKKSWPLIIPIIWLVIACVVPS